MKDFKSKATGYTLIEILVGLTIVGMVFSVGFASFRSFARRQSVVSTIRALKADLRLAQEQALAGKKPDSPNCNSPNFLDGYNFIVDSSNQYTIEARCTGGTVALKQVSLDNMTISSPFPNPILFKVLGQGTNIAGASQANIVVEEVQTGFALAIAVLPSGDISEIAVPLPTPIPTVTPTPTVTSVPTATPTLGSTPTATRTPTPTATRTPTPTATRTPTPTLTRTPTPTSTLTATPTPVPTGNIFANPTNCSIPFGFTTCSSTISWSSTNASSVAVWIDNNPSNVFATGSSGSKVADFIDIAGYWFYLKGAPVSGGSVVTLDSVFVAGTSGPTPTPTSTSTPTPTGTPTPTRTPTPTPTPSGPSWWNANYLYRKKITIINNYGSTVVSNTIVKFIENTSTLISSSKLRSNGNDWRIAYWNGSAWVALARDVYNGWNTTSTETWFRIQAAINNGASNDNYYVYYGYSGETTTPTTLGLTAAVIKQQLTSKDQQNSAMDLDDSSEYGGAQAYSYTPANTSWYVITKLAWYCNREATFGTQLSAAYIFSALNQHNGQEITNGKGVGFTGDSVVSGAYNDATFTKPYPRPRRATTYYASILPRDGRTASSEYFRWAYADNLGDGAYNVPRTANWSQEWMGVASDYRYQLYGYEAPNDNCTCSLGTEQIQ